MNYRLLWDWEQASGFDAKQAEEMRLEQGRFGQFHEPRGGSSLPHPAGDFTPGSEFQEQSVVPVVVIWKCVRCGSFQRRGTL